MKLSPQVWGIYVVRPSSNSQSHLQKEPHMEPFIGQIQLLPYDFAPAGWVACEGQLLPIEQNAALFSLIGTKYGGIGVITFALPDLRGKEPLPDTRYCIALSGIYPSRG